MILPTESINAANGDKSRQGESPTPFHRTVSARDEKRGGTELKGGKKRKVRIFQPGKEGFVIVGNWEIVESIVFLSLSLLLFVSGANNLCQEVSRRRAVLARIGTGY